MTTKKTKKTKKTVKKTPSPPDHDAALRRLISGVVKQDIADRIEEGEDVKVSQAERNEVIDNVMFLIADPVTDLVDNIVEGELDLLLADDDDDDDDDDDESGAADPEVIDAEFEEAA